MKNHITNIDRKTRTHVSGANLRVTGAEGGTFLMARLPSDGIGATDDGAAHAAKFEEWELYTLTYRITDLGPQPCITLCGELMVLVSVGWEGIGIGFRIRCVWKGHLGVEWSFLHGSEDETVIDGQMDVMKYEESSVEMASRLFVDIR